MQKPLMLDYEPDVDVRPRVKAWWQTTPANVIRDKLGKLPTGELRALSEEVNGVVESLSIQLETNGQTDIEWWKRARGALAFTQEKRSLIEAELVRRRYTDAVRATQETKNSVTEALKALETGNTSEARRVLLALGAAVEDF